MPSTRLRQEPRPSEFLLAVLVMVGLEEKSHWRKSSGLCAKRDPLVPMVRGVQILARVPVRLKAGPERAELFEISCQRGRDSRPVLLLAV
jgi:hypothetical protein